MNTISKNITINSPVTKVFSYLTDPLNQIEMNPSVQEIVGITGNGIGQKWRWKSKLMGLTLKGEGEVIDFKVNKRYVVKTTGDLISTWSYYLDSIGDLANLNMRIEYTFPIPIFGAIGETILFKYSEKALNTEIANIKNKLEGQNQNDYA